MKKNKIVFFENVLQILVIIASFLIIVTLSLEIFRYPQDLTAKSFLNLQFWICIFFLFDFFVSFFLAKQKMRYFFTHFIFLIVSIPYLSIIDYFYISVSNEVYYFLRLAPIIRGGYALVMVVNWFTKSKMSNLFISYLLLLMTIVYFSSLIFYVLEKPVNNMVPNYESALWWAFMDVTTVGSNIYAVTSIGKFLSVFLAALGMMMFPIFTVYITDKMQRTIPHKSS